MAPVAGFLASGGHPEKLGPRKAIADLACSDIPAVRQEADGSLWGTVVAVDRFGNVVTNIGRGLLTSAWEDDLKQISVVKIGNHPAIPLVASYSAVPAGELLATIGSRDTLEIAVNQGHAGMVLGVVSGTPIHVSRNS